MTEKRTSSGIPLKDRTEGQIRETFAGEAEDVIAAAVQLHAYAVKNGLGVSTLGAQSGIPGGVISQFFNHSYAGDYSAVAGRIQKFFWRLEQKALYGGLREFVETGVARALWAVFDKTRVIRRIQWIRSPEQLGKTRAASEYTHSNNSGRTMMVEIPGGTRAGFGAFLWALAEQLGIPYSAKLMEKRVRIRHALEACDLIIIDEAHLVWGWTDRDIAQFLDYLRTDVFANGDRGVVLIETNCDGMAQLETFRRRARYNVGQLIGRMRNEVIQIDPAEDITEGDVRALVGRYYKPGAATIRKLHAIACRERLGHFGLLLDIVNEAWATAKGRKQELTDEIVEATAERIIAALKGRKGLYE
jgi:DNA transposition AAA+ family ATPase